MRRTKSLAGAAVAAMALLVSVGTMAIASPPSGVTRHEPRGGALRGLVGVDELLRLRDCGGPTGRALRSPYRGREPDDGCFRLGDDTVPIVHGKGVIPDPANVLRLPVSVA